MKKIIRRVGKVAAIVALAIIVLLGGSLVVTSYRNDHYYDFVQSGGSIEAKYTAMGPHGVSHQTFPVRDKSYKEYVVWYPSDLAQQSTAYPLVVMANGTGITASKYSAVFKHLASWGFVVVGNEDENSRTGQSSAESLDYMLQLNDEPSSMFYRKIDSNSIGIAGHSQGGVGAINAVSTQKNGGRYKAMFTASATSSYWGQKNVLGTDWSYDISKITIPYMMVAGTGQFDAGSASDITATTGQGIAPLWSLQQNYNAISNSVSKVMARRVAIDHGDMLTHADGYMTAWFLYWLKGDVSLSSAFWGDTAEIKNNPHWQDAKTNMLRISN